MRTHLRRAFTWDKDGANWPHRSDSHFVDAGGYEWHVQIVGNTPGAPSILMLHGTGASGHSFHHLAELLADDYTCIIPDLPGHGFTAYPGYRSLALRQVAAGVHHLLEKMEVTPCCTIGHSAGAAIAVTMALKAPESTGEIISLNGAILPFRGATSFLFPAMAKLLFLNPLTPRIFSANVTRKSTEKLIATTGSHLDDAGVALYQRLLSNPHHVAGVLGMMAHWRLEPLVDALPDLQQKLHLVICDKDGAVPPSDGRKVAYLAPKADMREIPALGHLAHEEAPEQIADMIRAIVRPISNPSADKMDGD